MGYIDESSDSREFGQAANWRSALTPLYGSIVEDNPCYLVSGSAKTQFGFRSRPPQGEVVLSHSGSWASATSASLEGSRLQLATTPDPRVRDRSSPVNDRRFSSTTYLPAVSDTSLVTDIRSEKYLWSELGFGAGFTSLPLGMPTQPPSDSQVKAQGALLDKRLRAVRPTKPAFGLTRALIELKDFPRLVTHASEIARLKASGFAPGKNYLAYQFGIAPMISDIQNGARAVLSATAKLQQFNRDSGRLVRRSVHSEPEVSSGGLSSVPLSYGYTLWNGDRTCYNGSLWILDHGYTTKSWSTAFGMYEYFVGDPGNLSDKLVDYERKANVLLGTSLTPQVVWQVTPWSWLIDWFVDVSGLLGYQQDVADYSLALRRGGYSLFQETNAFATVETSWNTSWGLRIVKSVAPMVSWTSHVRTPTSSPYGLVTDWSELSSFQLSILAALGMQRVRL